MSNARLLPQPLPRCPMTWQTQWWWLDYQIDLAAALVHEEIYQMAQRARRELLGSGAKRRANVPDLCEASLEQLLEDIKQYQSSRNERIAIKPTKWWPPQ